MRQVKALLEAPCGGVPATYLSSQLGARERRAVLAELAAAAPTCKLLYVTPEQLVKSGALVDALTRLRARGRLARLVVDEARPPCGACWCELHCAACTDVRAGQQHCMPCWNRASDCLFCGGDSSNPGIIITWSLQPPSSFLPGSFWVLLTQCTHDAKATCDHACSYIRLLLPSRHTA